MELQKILDSEKPLISSYDDKYENTNIDEVEKQAALNDPVALYELAYRCRCGEGGAEKNPARSMALYKKVLEYEKNVNAIYRIGYGYLSGVMGEAEEYKCVSYFRAGTELGDADSAIQYGLLFEYGNFVEKDLDKALELYEYAVRHGREDACYNMGEIYRLKGEITKALDCYEKTKDNPGSMLALGWFYEDGEGVLQDDKAAFEFYKCAYEAGHPDSCYFLGRMYYLGKGTKENDKKAFELFKEASEKGDLNANIFLGTMYGFGVEDVADKNLELAIDYLNNVSEHFEVQSWLVKGKLFLGEKKVEQAKVWLEKAGMAGNEEARQILMQISHGTKSILELAEEGDLQAMLKISNYYMVDKEHHDVAKAMEWARKAVNQYDGNVEALENLSFILRYVGHIRYKIGAIDDAFLMMQEALSICERLRKNNSSSAKLEDVENDCFMDCGEIAWRKDQYDLALDLLRRVDKQKYPYAAVLILWIHSNNAKEYEQEVPKDIRAVNLALSSETWRNNTELAGAYYILSVCYVCGIGTYKDVKMAYECILKCAELDYEIAEPQLKKYHKGFLGKVKYIE